MVVTKHRKNGARLLWSNGIADNRRNGGKPARQELVDEAKALCQELGYNYYALDFRTARYHIYAIERMKREKVLREEKESGKYQEKRMPRRVPKAKDNESTI